MSPTTHSPTHEDFQRQTDDFMTWLAGRSGVKINPKIRVQDLRSQAAGRGVVAQSDIAEGEELFTIPPESVLSARTSTLKDLLSHDLNEFGPWLSLILVMIYEYLRGEQSAWKPYFNVLPQNFDTLMFWSPAELQELQGSAIVGKIGKQSAEEMILETIAPVIRENPTFFPPVGGLTSYDGEAGTRALLNIAHTMGSIIMAYAFDIENPEDEDEQDAEDGYMTDEEEGQSKGMVPLADMLNADADRNNARLFQEDGSLIMKAIKPIKQGDEIFNDYGELPRVDLLRRYGYVTDNYAPYDVAELSLKHICQAAGLENADIESQPRLQILEEMEVLDDGYVIPRISGDDSLTDILPVELILLLKTLTLPSDQFQKHQSKNKLPKPSLDQEESAILAKTIQLESAQYGTTIEQDHEILSRLIQSGASSPLDESSRRQKMAVQVRIGEKEILQSLFSLLGSSTDGKGSSASKRSAAGDSEQSRNPKIQKT
ncbi:SET domain protein [Aspergillus campestris IBT 28561]|uniref:Ribosomal lysine N-methyltransferase 4 n=1 Tax=Aspergillus campestris (strain IBT 28561) TaxID=1392248 RepID=A0A2I1DAE6_ASPC2|nr:SET domain protein [Aspergillus campestris IBT 28561]PKY06836.1 SET domain protein [Aspergillus campestris IBT 28561]